MGLLNLNLLVFLLIAGVVLKTLFAEFFRKFGGWIFGAVFLSILLFEGATDFWLALLSQTITVAFQFVMELAGDLIVSANEGS